MSWENVTLDDVQVKDNKYPPLDPGEVVAAILPTASLRTRTSRDGKAIEQLAFRAAIVEGDQKGRQFFLEYPDPESLNNKGEKNAWSAKAFKLLTMVLGIDLLPGEQAVDYINRIGINQPHFGITLAPDNYTNAQGEVVNRVKPGLFTVRAAA